MNLTPDPEFKDFKAWVEIVRKTRRRKQPATDDMTNLPPAKKRRIFEDDDHGTPRPARHTVNAPRVPSSPTTNTPLVAVSQLYYLELHKSRRLSPVRNLQELEDFLEQPVVFCNFDSHQDRQEPADVTIMRTAIQRFADGIGILGYKDVNAIASTLPNMDRMRFQYPWANSLERRCELGRMPSLVLIQAIIEAAKKYDRGMGGTEDEWNCHVQHPLLKLARMTSNHQHTLEIYNV